VCFVAVLAAGSIFGACGDQPAGPRPPPVEDDPSFTIEVRYWGPPPSPPQQDRIRRAADRWERLFRGGLPDAAARVDAGCGPGSPAIDEVVDDLVVFVRVIDIRALAESGPCKVRARSGLPITATVWIDGPKRINQLSPDILEALVTHELGHALGFGTLWPRTPLLKDPVSEGGQDPHFEGAAALAAFDLIGGAGFLGAKVPVENRGGVGTEDTHWRVSVFGESELMSFTVVSGANPLSRVTAASMSDLGYHVDLSEADDFVLPGTAVRGGIGPRLAPSAAGSSEALKLTESLPRWSITVTDRDGEIVREIGTR